MYTDYAPRPNFPIRNYKGHQVVVVEGGEKAKDVIRLARDEELTTQDEFGNEIFCVVLAWDPRQIIVAYTGKALRQMLWLERTRKGH